MPLTAHLAIGWSVFAICLIGSLIFSWLFVLWLRSVRENESSGFTNLIVSLCLCITIVSALLVPVDVFLVSSMKNADGSYQEWAKDHLVREEYLFKIKMVYYVLFCVVLAMSFLILPLTFFYHTTSPLAEDEEEIMEETVGGKLCRALKYTSASVLLLVVLILLGIFLPFETSTLERGFGQYMKDSWVEFKTSEGVFEMIVFLMNSISVVGLFLLVIYTAIGIASLPCDFIRGTNKVIKSISQLESQMKETEERLSYLRNNEEEGATNGFEQDEANRLEQELSMLNRQKTELIESSRGCFLICYKLLRPFQIITGMMFFLLGLLIFLSLILNNIDKAIHSSAQKGYILNNGTLPNPMDMALVFLQNTFPLDYILYLGMVLFFLITSISGVKRIGIRFMWLRLYKIAPHSTKPQALALMSLTLILILVASNILFYSVAPDYTTYGSQHFVDIIKNQTVVERCNNVHAPPDECNMTIIATFLLAFHTKAWIFGAVYYWLTWIFIAIILGGSCFSLFHCTRRSRGIISSDPNEDEDELLNNES